MSTGKLVIRRYRRKKKNGLEKSLTAGMLGVCILFSTGFTNGNRNVTVNADGASVTFQTKYTSPELILNQAGIKMNHHDEYTLQKHDSKREEITVHRAVPVTLHYQGQNTEVYTSKQTVGDALKDLGYTKDAYEADLDPETKITSNLKISITDIPQKPVEKVPDPVWIPAENSEPVAPAYSEAPVVYTEMGPVGYAAAMTMEATAYLPTDGSATGITATGVAAQRGIVAVDPDVIPLGTSVYIPGYGVALAADTGGAINGHRIDLCMESYDEAMQFGRRDVTVYVLQ